MLTIKSRVIVRVKRPSQIFAGRVVVERTYRSAARKNRFGKIRFYSLSTPALVTHYSLRAPPFDAVTCRPAECITRKEFARRDHGNWSSSGRCNGTAVVAVTVAAYLNNEDETDLQTRTRTQYNERKGRVLSMTGTGWRAAVRQKKNQP